MASEDRIKEPQSQESNPLAQAVMSTHAPSGSEMPRQQTAALVLAGTGLTLSLLLEQLHIKTHTVPSADHFCSVSSNFDCAAVAASPYALFWGLPWAIWGALGYLALGIASYRWSKWLLPLAAGAAATSLALFALSVFFIRSVCFLCEAVHIVSIALFVIAYRYRGDLNATLRNREEALSVLGLPAGLACALWLVVPEYWSAFSWRAEPPFSTGTTPDGYPWIGSSEPDVTIHEYVNYKCPFCKMGSTRLLRELGSHGTWRIVRHQQPLMNCPHGRESACKGSRLAYCAGKQGKFWQADRWLFTFVDFDKNFDRERMIRDLDLDEANFVNCYSSPEAFEYSRKSFEDARKKGIDSVPGYEIESEGPIPEVLAPLAKKARAREEKARKAALKKEKRRAN